MNTQTHLLLASAVLGRRATVGEHAAIAIGALSPDLSIFVLVAVAAVTGLSGAEVWDGAYWAEPWQTLSAISNSFPLWLGALAVGWALRRPAVVLFCAAALLHLAFDLPLHAVDAHRHFWPLSDWRFHSPISYWDPEHHGQIVSLVEAIGGLFLVASLWRRHDRRWVRVGLVLCALSYAAIPAFWLVAA